MQVLSSITALEAIAFQRLSEENFIDLEVDFNYSMGVFTGYFQITSTVSIDFTDSRFCLADEGEKIAEISPELERACERYLEDHYKNENNEDEYDFADLRIKQQKEN